MKAEPKNELHLYLRCSIASAVSLNDQKEKGLRMAEKLGMTPIIHYEVSDDFIQKRNRPILFDLLEKMEGGEVKNLYVSSLCRLSRDGDLYWKVRNLMKANEVSLYVGDGLEVNVIDPKDDFIFGVLAEFQKFETKSLSNV